MVRNRIVSVVVEQQMDLLMAVSLVAVVEKMDRNLPLVVLVVFVVEKHRIQMRNQEYSEI